MPILTKSSIGAFLGADIRDGGKRRRFLADRRQYRFSKAIRRKWALEKCCDTICHRLTDAFAWSDLSALATYSDKLMPPCPAQPLTSESHESNKNGSSSGALWGRCKASRNTLCPNEYNIHKINPKMMFTRSRRWRTMCGSRSLMPGNGRWSQWQTWPVPLVPLVPPRLIFKGRKGCTPAGLDTMRHILFSQWPFISFDVYAILDIWYSDSSHAILKNCDVRYKNVSHCLFARVIELTAKSLLLLFFHRYDGALLSH